MPIDEYMRIALAFCWSAMITSTFGRFGIGLVTPRLIVAPSRLIGSYVE